MSARKEPFCACGFRGRNHEHARPDGLLNNRAGRDVRKDRILHRLLDQSRRALGVLEQCGVEKNDAGRLTITLRKTIRDAEQFLRS